MNKEKTKICSKCKIQRLLEEFDKDKTKKDGYYSSCKICKKKYHQEHRERHREYCKGYFQKNKERIKKRQHNHYLKNKEKISKRDKEYYLNNSAKIIKKQSTYYQKNKEKIKAQHRGWYQRDKQKISKKGRRYRKKHREEIKIRRKNYQPKVNERSKKRYHRDINYKLARLLRCRINVALKGKTKSKKTMELLGCSIEELKSHLEKQFEEGMTWGNYRYHGWHVDHQIPCNCFNLSKLEEQKKCFHFSNLRPLWQKENMSRPDDGSDISS